MSWSASKKIKRNAQEINELEQLATMAARQSNPDGEDQAQLAARVVNDILTSDVLGNSEKIFSVSISGHGNPDHEPKSGWSNDMINISISQVES